MYKKRNSKQSSFCSRKAKWIKYELFNKCNLSHRWKKKKKETHKPQASSSQKLRTCEPHVTAHGWQHNLKTRRDTRSRKGKVSTQSPEPTSHVTVKRYNRALWHLDQEGKAGRVPNRTPVEAEPVWPQKIREWKKIYKVKTLNLTGIRK